MHFPENCMVRQVNKPENEKLAAPKYLCNEHQNKNNTNATLQR